MKRARFPLVDPDLASAAPGVAGLAAGTGGVSAGRAAMADRAAERTRPGFAGTVRRPADRPRRQDNDCAIRVTAALARRQAAAGAMRFALVALLAAMPWRGAAAEALLRRSVPPAGDSLRAAPAEVWLDFSEMVDAPRSSIHVTDVAGSRVDHDNLRGDPDEVRRLAIGLQPLKPGAYRVEWQATSIDAHRTDGSYGFVILDMQSQ